MKETMRKLLATMLSFLMLFSSLPTNAIAEGVASLLPKEEGKAVVGKGDIVDYSNAFQYPIMPLMSGYTNENGTYNFGYS